LNNWNEELSVEFNQDKTFKQYHHQEEEQTVSGCNNKDISELILENRTISFVTSKERSDTDSIFKQFPDAITCGNGVIFYFEGNTTNISTYIQITIQEDRVIKFKPDGTFKSKTDTDATKDCDGKSIEQLYNDCSAFNFVTEKVTTVTGKNTNYEINDWPHALECSTNNTIKNIFYQLSLKITSENLIRYSPNSDKDKVIDFNADGTYKSTTTTVQEGCIDKSLTDLAAEGRAYKFSSENHIYRAVCTTTESMIDGWPDA